MQAPSEIPHCRTRGRTCLGGGRRGGRVGGAEATWSVSVHPGGGGATKNIPRKKVAVWKRVFEVTETTAACMTVTSSLARAPRRSQVMHRTRVFLQRSPGSTHAMRVSHHWPHEYLCSETCSLRARG